MLHTRNISLCSVRCGASKGSVLQTRHQSMICKRIKSHHFCLSLSNSLQNSVFYLFLSLSLSVLFLVYSHTLLLYLYFSFYQFLSLISPFPCLYHPISFYLSLSFSLSFYLSLSLSQSLSLTFFLLLHLFHSNSFCPSLSFSFSQD